jgi:hypothetical protein
MAGGKDGMGLRKSSSRARRVGFKCRLGVIPFLISWLSFSVGDLGGGSRLWGAVFFLGSLGR